MSHVAFQPHEHEGHLVYTEHGVSPYWAWGAVVRDGFGWNANDVRVDVAGSTWEVDVYFSESGLIARDDDPVDGRLNEYRIKARPAAPNDRRKFTLKISPRWNGQETMSGDELETPFQHDTVTIDGNEIDMPDAGVDIQFQTSNLETPTRPAELVPEFLQALAQKSGQYFDHDYLRIYHSISSSKALEGYVRHRDETQEQLVSSDGVLMGMFHLLGDTEGSLINYHADNQEKVGHLHKVKIEEKIEKMLPGHRYSKQFKSYHPENVIDTGPLSEPKFGVLVVNGWQDETIHFDDLESVWQEIEEAGTNVLSWAGIQTGVDGPWVEDDHFEVKDSDVDVKRIDNPLPVIEASQEAHVVKLLTEATEADYDILKELATDGGESHHAVLEQAAERGSSTVYRMLQRIPELVESDNGYISFASEKLYQDTKDILQRTEKQIQSASERVANMLGIEADVLDDAKHSVRRFAQKYAADFENKGNRLVVKLNAVVAEIRSADDAYPKIWRVVDELLGAIRGSQYRHRMDNVWITYENTAGQRRGPISAKSPRLAQH